MVTLFEGLGTSASVFQAELNAKIMGITEVIRIGEPIGNNLEKFGLISKLLFTSRDTIAYIDRVQLKTPIKNFK